MDRSIFKAAESGNEVLFQGLEEHKFDQVTPQKNTILHIAVRFNQMGITKKILLLRPRLLHQENACGESPLHVAAKIGNVEMVELLVGGNSKDIESQQAHITRMKNLNDKDTALHLAVKNGHCGVAKLLMEKDAELLDLVNGANESPLFLAVEGGSLDTADYILQHFPCAPCCGSNDMNALHAAVIRAHHAPVNYRTPNLSKEFSSLSKVRHLLRGFFLNAGDQIFNREHYKEYQKKEMDIMKRLLEKGERLAEGKDIFEWTPLHCAAHLGHLEATQLLLQNSSTCNIAYFQDKKGMSALHIAAKQGHVNVMEEIIHHSPDVCDLVDKDGKTPLHVAVVDKKLNVVKYILKTPLLENIINVADKDGNTPLHLAAGNGKYSLIKTLVDDKRVHKKAQNLNFEKPVDMVRTNPNIGLLYKSMVAKYLEKEGGRPSLQSLVHGCDYESLDKAKIISRAESKREREIDNKQVSDEGKEMRLSRLKNISNIHLLVASLIATVTFTAGFTMPGGSEDQDILRKGLPILYNKISFQLFVVADSIAFYCSAASVFLQFCGSVEHGSYHLLLRFTRVAAALTYISSLGMVVAFTSAMYAVMPNSSKLANYICVSGTCCVFAYIFGFL